MAYTQKHFTIMRLWDRLRMNASRCDQWLASHFGVPSLECLSNAQCDHAIDMLTIGRTLMVENTPEWEDEFIKEDVQ